MKSTLLGSRPFGRLLLLANGAFWVVFAINFLANSHTYRPHPPMFEEQSPLYAYYGRALPAEQYMTPLMRTTRFLQWPSFFAARPYFWYFESHGIDGERLYGGISVTGYYLIIVCVISFLQWYLAGLFVDYLRRRLSTSPNRTSGNPGHAYDARQ
jgi:hypothetical protein